MEILYEVSSFVYSDARPARPAAADRLTKTPEEDIEGCHGCCTHWCDLEVAVRLTVKINHWSSPKITWRCGLFHLSSCLLIFRKPFLFCTCFELLCLGIASGLEIQCTRNASNCLRKLLLQERMKFRFLTLRTNRLTLLSLELPLSFPSLTLEQPALTLMLLLLALLFSCLSPRLVPYHAFAGLLLKTRLMMLVSSICNSLGFFCRAHL